MTTIASHPSASSRDRVHILIDRLDRGWVLIDGEIDPIRRSRLEDHWTTLLREYEAACDHAIAGDAGGAT